jgi:hypothetical protein
MRLAFSASVRTRKGVIASHAHAKRDSVNLLGAVSTLWSGTSRDSRGKSGEVTKVTAVLYSKSVTFGVYLGLPLVNTEIYIFLRSRSTLVL